LVIVDADGAEFVPARTWNPVAGSPAILDPQLKPVVESVPTRSCQQPEV
jgi:hypothetical protein